MDEVAGERAAPEDAAVEQQAAGATPTEHALVALRSGWGDGRQAAAGPDNVARMIADDHAFMPVRGRVL